MVAQAEHTTMTRPLQGFATGPYGQDLCLLSGHPALVGTTFNYGHDEEIYGETEKALSFYKVVSGAVRTHKLLSDGRRQIGAFHFEGDLFGFEAGEVHRFTAEAVVEATVLVFKRQTLEQLAARDLNVARWLWALTARNLSHAEEHMMLLGRKTATERVAAFLLEMDECMQPVASITLPMSRRDIADYLGLSVETVSRTISQLQNEGTVELLGKREVTLHSRARLRALRSEEGWQ